MSISKKDFLTLLDYSPDEIWGLLTLAKQLKQDRLKNDPKIFAGKTGVLIFEKPSLRTRITFETAIFELGGFPTVLTNEMVGMGKRETVEDIARNLTRLVHLIVARTYSHETLVSLAKHCTIPVVNALSDRFHPCQALAFGLALQEKNIGSEKPKIVFIGDGNNVCHSLMVLSAKLGYHFTAVCPQGYTPLADIVDKCKMVANSTNGKVSVTQDIKDTVKNADVIYTDVWTSMGQESEAEIRQKVFTSYQVNEELVKLAPSHCLISHCLPAHRGEEITSGVLDSENSIAFEEAENRLHVQKAIIVHLLSGV